MMITVDRLTGDDLEQALLRLLYDRGRLNTSQITGGLPPFRYMSRRCDHPRDCTDPSHLRDMGPRRYSNSDVTQSLKRLVKRELICHGPPLPDYRGQGDTWWPVDWREPSAEEQQLEAALAVLASQPRDPKVLDSRWRAVARGRALSELARRHRAEFEQLWREETGKIVDSGEGLR